MTRSPWDVTPDMVLTESQADALLAHVRGRAATADGAQRLAAATDRLIVEALLFSGLRCSEFCALRVGDVRDRTLYVRGRRGADRSVAIPAALERLVHSYLRQVRPRLPAPGRAAAADDPLLLNERAGGYERTGLYRRVVRILTEAGLGDKASVQLLRHTYGYLAYLRTGGNLLFVQRQLGHAHPIVTSVYARLVPESYADLAECVSGGGAQRSRSKRVPLGVRT